MSNEPSGRIPQLDGLRGYAALAVVVYHAILEADPSQVTRLVYTNITRIEGGYDRLNKLVLMFFNGELAVDIFFVLSGAVLFDSFRRDTSSFVPASVRFLVRRFFRIYPALLVCLFVAFAVFLIQGKPTGLMQLFQNLLLYDFQLNGPTWTLQVEFIAAAVLLLVFFCYRISGEVALILSGLGLVLLFKVPIFSDLPIKIFWLCFVLGAAIPTRLGAALAAVMPRWSWLVAMVAMILFRSDMQRLSAAILVLLLYYGNAGSLGRLLERPSSLFFGRISYSLYLYNPVVLLLFSFVGGYLWANQHPLEAGLPLALVLIAITIPIAYLSTLLIEKPFIDLGRRLTARRQVAPTARVATEIAGSP